MGENVTFILAPEAQPSLTRLGSYWWPANYVPTVAEQRLMAGDSQGSRSGPIATLLPAVLVPVVVALVAVALVAALLLRRRHQKQLDQLRYQVYAAGVSSQDSCMSDKPPGGTTEPSLSHSMLGSSRRSSREGGSRPAGSSCAISVSEPSGDLHVDMEHIQMLQAGVPYHNGSALQDRMSTFSPVHGHTYLQSPHSEHCVRFHGFCPVIEGVPAASSSFSGLQGTPQLPLPPGSRCASSSSSSSHGRALTSRGHELAKAVSSRGSSSGSLPQGAASRPAAGAADPSSAAAASEVCGGSLATTVATGLEKWRIAVSTTTRQLAERRLAEQQALSVSRLHHSLSITPPKGRLPSDALPANTASFSSSCCQEQPRAQPSDQQQQAQQRPDARQQQQQQGEDAAARQQQDNSERSGVADLGSSLLLKRVLGRGSFGQVWLGTWRGISVAVKIMHLPLNVLVHQKDHKQQQQPDQQQPDRHASDQQQPGQQQEEQDQQQASTNEASISLPHFAIMEAVLSSQCAHPNVSCRGMQYCMPVAGC
jgi:hypothetical protein